MVFNKEHPSLDDALHKLGRWLRVSGSYGNDMSYWVLTEGGNVISTSTLQHVTQAEMERPAIKELIDKFIEKLRLRLSDLNFTSQVEHREYLEDTPINLNPDHDPRRRVIPTDEEYGDMIVEQPSIRCRRP